MSSQKKLFFMNATVTCNDEFILRNRGVLGNNGRLQTRFLEIESSDEQAKVLTVNRQWRPDEEPVPYGFIEVTPDTTISFEAPFES